MPLSLSSSLFHGGVFFWMAVGGVLIVIFVVLIFVVLPLVLAQITSWRIKMANNNKANNDKKMDWNSSLFVGRMWHYRHGEEQSQSKSQSQSQSHAFSYPLFMFGLDLKEVEEDHLFSNVLWPLSILLNFKEKDHLKNGEGMAETSSSSSPSSLSNQQQQQQQSLPVPPQPHPRLLLSERIYALVAQRTQNKFQPNAQTHSIILVTHLQYYGYCFNPVSFYYILSKSKEEAPPPPSQQQQQQQTTRLAAIVAEVSNTPWNEMYPYVLHPDSTDDVKVKYTTTMISNSDDGDGDDEKKRTILVNYVFRKQFHVSPFMEMQYYYDWQFDDTILDHFDASSSVSPTTKTNTTMTDRSSGPRRSRRRIHVVTNMRKISPDDNDKDISRPGELKFRGGMKVVEAISSSFDCYPFLLAWHTLIRYPIYCMIIQVWIHYQAFWLFYKGVAFQPHPDGTETAASRIIGSIMKPFFALQEMLHVAPKGKAQEDGSKKSD